MKVCFYFRKFSVFSFVTFLFNLYFSCFFSLFLKVVRCLTDNLESLNFRFYLWNVLLLITESKSGPEMCLLMFGSCCWHRITDDLFYHLEGTWNFQFCVRCGTQHVSPVSPVSVSSDIIRACLHELKCYSPVSLFIKTFLFLFSKNEAFYGSPVVPERQRLLNVINDKNKNNISKSYVLLQIVTKQWKYFCQNESNYVFFYVSIFQRSKS